MVDSEHRRAATQSNLLFLFTDPDLQADDGIGESLVSAHLGVEFNLRARPRVGITLHAARVKRLRYRCVCETRAVIRIRWENESRYCGVELGRYQWSKSSYGGFL